MLAGTHSATYDEWITDPVTCEEDSYVQTITEESRYGYFSHVGNAQDVNLIFTLSGFIVVAGNPFPGHLHLPFIGPDCSWYYQDNDCENDVQFSGSYAANSITSNIDHTIGNEHFEGQLTLGLPGEGHACIAADVEGLSETGHDGHLFLDAARSRFLGVDQDAHLSVSYHLSDLPKLG